MKTNIVIAGRGVVGEQMSNFFNGKCEFYDPPKGMKPVSDKFQFAFICVPTDNIEGFCDISKIENVLSSIEADYYIIKSTVPPTTTEKLTIKFDKKIIFSPEYCGNTSNNHNLNKHFVILGGEAEYCKAVAQLYMKYTPSNFNIELSDSRTAELSKYMENSFIATKVVFMNDFYRMAKKLDVDFLKLRKQFNLDERFSSFFTFVIEDQPYYNSHCLNKDLPSLKAYMNTEHHYNPPLLDQVIKINEMWLKQTSEE